MRRPGPAWAARRSPRCSASPVSRRLPALAGQFAAWPRRAALGALGYWWLVLAEPMWRGGCGSASRPRCRRGRLGGVRSGAADHVIAPLLTIGVLLGALLWAAGAAVLPWIVRGRHAAFERYRGATAVWTAALASAAPLIARGGLGPAGGPTPRGVVLGSLLGGLFVVTARAARGWT